MPVRGDTQINSFVKGLVTEASPLSFPPNTALDILNFKLQKDGTNYRRLGLDFEDNYLLTATGYSTDVLATARKAFYHWQLPNGNPLVDIGVVQIGAKFWFLNLYAENPSAVILNGGLPVTSTVDPSSRFSFAVINNYLIVVSNNLPDPFLVSYNGTTDTITFETSPILVRDMWGVDDGLDVNTRPSSLTPTHWYNLLNQGWDNQIQTTCGAGINAVDCTFLTFGIYPSNSDVWTIGRIGDLTSANVSKYDPNIAQRNIFNIGQVPQGHYIVPFKHRGLSRKTQTGLTVPLDQEIGMFSCVAAYAGRAFYSGILSTVASGDNRSPILSGTVFFSQVFEQKIQLVRCYQEADPTSPDISDIIDTDGGIIFIPECSVINHLRAVKESLLVFAVNGVWEIRGDDGGFRATSFQVQKISNTGVYSPDSIIEINGTVMYWGINGIYALARNQFGIWETNSLTQSTIQKLYNSIPDFARSQAKGFYDLNNNTVRWLFYSDDAKVIGQPVDVIPPTPTITNMVASALSNVSGASRRHPEIIKIDSTHAIMFYTNTTPNILYYSILTINSDSTVSVGSENIFLSGSTVNGFAGMYLQDNKILLAYKTAAAGTPFVRIVNFSALVPTFGATTALDATHNLAMDATQCRLGFVNQNRVIFTAINTDNAKIGTQIIDISTSDVITANALTKSATINHNHPRIEILSPVLGVIGTSTTPTNTAGRLTPMAIGATTVTYGTAADITNASQFPAPTVAQFFFADISKIDASHIFCIGGGSNTTASVVVRGSTVMKAVVTSTGITTTKAVLDDSSISPILTSDPTSVRTACRSKSNFTLAILDHTSRGAILVRYTNTDPPTPFLVNQLETSDAVDDPEIIEIGSNVFLGVYRNITEGGIIKAFTVEAT